VFVSAFLCAQVICVIFDAFRAIRKNISPSVYVVSIHDILFCSIAFFLIYRTFSVTNNAMVRWYEIASLFVSCTVYFLFESKYILNILTIIFSWFIRPLMIIAGQLYILSNALRNRVFAPFCSRISGFSKKCIKKLPKPAKKQL